MQRIFEAGKAVGILTILGASRLTSDVFTAQMKAFIPVRITFGGNSASDSRALFDAVGANLLGECCEMMVLLPENTVGKALEQILSDIRNGHNGL